MCKDTTLMMMTMRTHRRMPQISGCPRETRKTPCLWGQRLMLFRPRNTPHKYFFLSGLCGRKEKNIQRRRAFGRDNSCWNERGAAARAGTQRHNRCSRKGTAGVYIMYMMNEKFLVRLVKRMMSQMCISNMFDRTVSMRRKDVQGCDLFSYYWRVNSW